MDSAVSEEATRATTAILVKGGAVLLAQRPIGDRLAGHWELPGGKVEAGESPGGCLAPELREECGIEAVVGQQSAESTHRYPHATIRPLALLVDSRSGELVLHAHDDHRWVSLSDVEPFPSLRAEVQP
jgi:8-oxo-dGTP diphosphatase